jgi:hypothetical protein
MPPVTDLPPVTPYALVRSGLVLTGLLLLAVGLGNVIAGHSKIAQYDELVRATVPAVQPDPAALFPPTSEGGERHALARAKLAFYQLLVTAGQLLAALGGMLVMAGVLRLWMRASRAPADFPAAN